MSTSTSKKIVVYRFDRKPVRGFVNPQAWLTSGGLEVLTPAGAIVSIPYADVKAACFVKEFDGSGWNAERRLFVSRPKTEGLWVRALFRDADYIEGILPNDLLPFEPYGYLLAPPDAASNNQRVFLPRAALSEFRVMGVVGSPARRAKPRLDPRKQINLFE